MERFKLTLLTTLVCIAVQGLSCIDARAQTDKHGWSLKAGANRMTIGSFRDSYKSTGFNSYSLEFDYATDPSDGSDGFAAGYNFPVFGIGIVYNTLSDVVFKSKNGHYADMVALYGKMSRDLLRTRHLGFGYDISLGLSYSSGYYDPIDNRSNWFFSAPVLFYAAGGGHLTWFVGPRLDIEAGIDVRHNSSARFAYPNGGLNYWGGGLSARYRLKERNAPTGNIFRTRSVSSDLYKKEWNIEVYAGGGVHACAAEWLAFTKTESRETQAKTNLRKWPMASLSADAIYRISGRFGAGFTADAFWNSNTERLRWADSILYSEEENAASKGYSPFSFGVGLVQEIFWEYISRGKWAFTENTVGYTRGPESGTIPKPWIRFLSASVSKRINSRLTTWIFQWV